VFGEVADASTDLGPRTGAPTRTPAGGRDRRSDLRHPPERVVERQSLDLELQPSQPVTLSCRLASFHRRTAISNASDTSPASTLR
jgi:hypothetical protein